MFEWLEASVGGSATPCTTAEADIEAPTFEETLVEEIVALERAKAKIEARVMALTADLGDRASWWVDADESRLADPLGAAAIAACELAPALHLAPVTAGLRVQRAQRIRDWLPATLSLMAQGELDMGRVFAIDEATQFLSPQAAALVEQMVLPKAVDQTAGELRAALRKAVIAVDPDGAEDRRKAAVKGRRVSRYAREDGTSVLEAVLSAIDTGEIYDLIDEVARRTKTTGDTRSFDARRADALVWLMLGRDPQLGPEDPAPPPGSSPSDGDELVDEKASSADWSVDPTGTSGDDPGPEEPTDLDERFPSEPPSPGDEPSDGQPNPPQHADATASEPNAPQHTDTTAGSPNEDEPSGPQPTDTTTCQPNEDRTGAGRSSSEAAETPQHNCDDDDDERGSSQWPDAFECALRDAELNRFDQVRDARTGRISELATLALSAMISRRPQRRRWVALNRVRRPNGTTVLIGELQGYGPITGAAAQHLLASGAARAPDPPSGREPTPEQADRHDPPDWLDRDVRARDGTCRFAGCRQTSDRGDLDHTIRFPDGKTVPTNLGGLCRRHHLVKHCGAWHASQDVAGRFTWTSAMTGRVYRTYPRGTTGEWRGTTTLPKVRAAGRAMSRRSTSPEGPRR